MDNKYESLAWGGKQRIHGDKALQMGFVVSGAAPTRKVGHMKVRL